jgi:hypothetical protein
MKTKPPVRVRLRLVLLAFSRCIKEFERLSPEERRRLINALIAASL